MKKVATVMKSIWKDESAQGATEYILLLVIVVAVVTMFGKDIKQAVTDKLSDLSSGMKGITTQ